MEQRATCRCTAVARSSSREQHDSSLLFIEKRRLRDRLLLLLLPPRGCIDPCIKRRCTTTPSLPRATYSEEFDREITLAGERERLLSPAPPLALSRPEITGLTDSHGLETNAFVSQDRSLGSSLPNGEGRAAATEFARRPTFSPSTRTALTFVRGRAN